ncbi:MAG: tRNA uridine-5-carboxymethylaminomethyl(34) synthesis GTPase MnmE [Bacteroidetes bacterium]|nr:MAG: tRNA uridine-5-carboxymethylaminomethyl(34) synthesis GTPase MnmE [Bacteroidota bacterium]
MSYSHSFATKNDTICAVATPPGTGAIAIVRMSGPESLDIAFKLFTPFQENLKKNQVKSHHMYYGQIRSEKELVDEVLFTYFKAPHSYTGEDSVELSCHGSEFIQQKIVELLIKHGARFAEPGEYTLRAFLNGKLDLSQAEAVADLIASQSRSAHRMALNQMRGGFSEKIKELRDKLLQFTSLIELELDFSEEDVEFADRAALTDLLDELQQELNFLASSFKVGNVLKTGIPVAIIGKPNVGKSTLLNAILNEEKAIVSDIPGTTRDAIEDTIIIDGYRFRFIDTAGLRQAQDAIEDIGIGRTYDKIEQATIILYVCDISDAGPKKIEEILDDFKHYIEDENKYFILVANKIDQLNEIPPHLKEMLELETVFVSAKRKENIHLLAESLVNKVKEKSISSDIIVSNSRHYDALTSALKALEQVEKGLAGNVPTDLVAIDIRQALHYLGTITGGITTDEVLGSIFSKFCIGK